jgi:hypothetical protein
MVDRKTFGDRFSDEYEGVSAASVQRQPQDVDHQMKDQSKKVEADREQQQDGGTDRLADYFAIVGISPDLKQL